MDTQEITLHLPTELLRKLRLLAVERQTTVSGLLSATLERLVAEEGARARREELHEYHRHRHPRPTPSEPGWETYPFR